MRGNTWAFMGAAVLLHGIFLETARRAPGTNWLLLNAGTASDTLTVIDIESSTPSPPPREAPRAEPSPVGPRDVPPLAEPDAEPARAPPLNMAGPATIDEAVAEIDPNAFEGEASPFGEEASAAEPSSEPTAPNGPAISGSEWSSTEELAAVDPLSPFNLGGMNLANALAVENAQPLAAPTTIEGSTVSAEKSANQAVQSTVIGADKKVGIDLPATQVVVGAVATATRALPVAHNTRASFQITLDGSGKVTSVRVLKASGGDAATWQGAAKAAAASLAGRGDLALGSAKGVGATVTVDVKVRHVFPSGSAKGADVKPVCANQIINDIAEAASSGKTKEGADAEIPLFTDANGRPCIPVGVSVVSDETNIGATKQIQVQTASRVTINGKAALPSDLQKVDKNPFWVKGASDAPRPVAPFRVRKFEKKREKKK